MADNSTLPATGDVIRSEDRTGVKTQVVALDLNPAGAESLMAGAMPVTDNAGSLTVDAPVGTPAFVRLSDGAAAITTLPVSLASVPSHAVTNAGTFAVQAAAAGDVAHDAGDSGNPQKMGAVAIAHGTNPTAVSATLDRTNLYANMAGILFVIGGHPNVVTIRHTLITTAVTNVAIITAGAGTKIVVTRITVTVDNASTVFPSIIVGFGTASVPTGTGCLVYHGGVPAGGGFTIGDGSGILGIGADDEDLRVTTVGTVGGNGMAVTVSYYTVPA